MDCRKYLCLAPGEPSGPPVGEEAETMERDGRSVLLMGLDQLIQMAEENESAGAPALRSSITPSAHAWKR